MNPVDPWWGRRPVVGDRVYIDFGDSVYAHPEVVGLVTEVSDTTIGVDNRRYAVAACVHIEKLEEDA